MKEWKQDELRLARLLRGARRPVKRSADVMAGAFRVDVRRRKRLTCARWVAELEERAGGDCAVVVHVTGEAGQALAESGRWLVVLSLDEFRRVARLAGLLPE